LSRPSPLPTTTSALRSHNTTPRHPSDPPPPHRTLALRHDLTTALAFHHGTSLPPRHFLFTTALPFNHGTSSNLDVLTTRRSFYLLECKLSTRLVLIVLSFLPTALPSPLFITRLRARHGRHRLVHLLRLHPRLRQLRAHLLGGPQREQLVSPDEPDVPAQPSATPTAQPSATPDQAAAVGAPADKPAGVSSTLFVGVSAAIGAVIVIGAVALARPPGILSRRAKVHRGKERLSDGNHGEAICAVPACGSDRS
jgi:hypothetical protein